VRAPSIAFGAINAFDILSLCVIQSVLNSGMACRVYYLLPGQLEPVSLQQLATMFLGDLTGAFLVFILLNILMSVALRLRRFAGRS